MKRELLTAVAGLALLAPLPARADDAWQSVKSALADMFMGPEHRSDFHWSGKLAASRTLEVKGINGGITIEPGTTDAVEVQAVRKGRRSEPDSVKVVVLEHSTGITICSVYPANGGRDNVCQPGEGGHLGSRDNDVSVEYRIKAPAGAALRIETVNGGLDAVGFASQISAETVNGGIHVETTGAARAETVNGGIDARMGARFESAHFETVNGGIDLALPNDASAEIEAEVVNGGISCDFDLQSAHKTRRSLRGTIGSGGPKLALETVNGGIRIARH